MKHNFVKHFVLFLCFSALPLHARDFLKGTLAWNMDRQSAQFVPDVMITQNMVGAGNFSITSPGTYALAEDISFTATNAIIIASSDVTLNLNDHTITGLDVDGTNGVNISTGVQRITINNGNIVNCQGIFFTPVTVFPDDVSQLVIIDHINCYVSTTTSSNNFGIRAELNGANVLVRNCKIDLADTGIQLTSIGFIQQSIVTNSGIGYQLLSTEVEDCIAQECRLDGFAASVSDFRRCLAQACGVNGFSATGSSLVFEDCIAKQNDVGFFNAAIAATFKNCVSISNDTNGFDNNGNNVEIVNCTASQNGNFGISNNNSDVTIKNCVIIGNNGNGINNNNADVIIEGCQIELSGNDGINNSTAGVDVVIRETNILNSVNNGITNLASIVGIENCHIGSCTNGITNTGEFVVIEGNKVIRCDVDAISNSATNAVIKSNITEGSIAGFGINDTSGATTPNIFNNYSNANTAGNYSAGVPVATILSASLVTSTTGVYWVNISNP